MPIIENKYRIGERVKYRAIGMQPGGTGTVDSIMMYPAGLTYRVVPDQRGVLNAIVGEDDLEPAGEE